MSDSFSFGPFRTGDEAEDPAAQVLASPPRSTVETVVASDDWAADFDHVARLNNWTFLGQPQQYGRRYGHDAHTVRVYWDNGEKRVVRASLTRLGYTVHMVTDNTAADRALEWLRTVTED